MLNIQENQQEQAISQMIEQVQQELVNHFHKEEGESWGFIHLARLSEHLKKHPIALHDSPYHLALAVLLKNQDFQTLKDHES